VDFDVTGQRLIRPINYLSDTGEKIGYNSTVHNLFIVFK
jgi:hypothetical protein